MNVAARLRKFPFWSWLWFGLGALYFILPLLATFEFSVSWDPADPLKAYTRVFQERDFWETFLYSNLLAVATILMNIILIVPTAYWIRLRVPEARRLVEFLTLLPFVVPAIILVFGLIGVYSAPIQVPFSDVTLLKPLTTLKFGTNVLIVAGYMVLAMPYMYRSVDTGMRTVDVRTLTEAAQSLGASWFTIITRIILPNVRAALLSGALLTFAIVVGEVTLASFLGVDAFGPYLFLLGQHRAYEPAALSFFSFIMTWIAMGLIQLFTGGQGQAAGTR